MRWNEGLISFICPEVGQIVWESNSSEYQNVYSVSLTLREIGNDMLKWVQDILESSKILTLHYSHSDCYSREFLYKNIL